MVGFSLGRYVVGWLRTGHAVALLAREHVELVEAAREQLVEASPADRGAEQADGAYAGRKVGAQLVRIDLGTAGHADGFELGQETQRRQAARRDLGQLVQREACEPSPRRREAEAQGNVGEPCGLRRGWGQQVLRSGRVERERSVCSASAWSGCRAGAERARRGHIQSIYRAGVQSTGAERVCRAGAQTCAELKSISGSTGSVVPCAACRARRGARTCSAWKRKSSRAARRQSWHTAIATCSAPNESLRCQGTRYVGTPEADTPTAYVPVVPPPGHRRAKLPAPLVRTARKVLLCVAGPARRPRDVRVSIVASWPSHAGAASKGGGTHTAISVV